MIGMREALTLAHTKIRSKRIRLLVTTIVSGLVFGVMAGGTILVDGMSQSLASFARKNLDGRFLVSGTQNSFSGPISFDPNSATVIAEVQKYQAAYIAERKAAAARLGVEYDERTEPPAFTEDPNPQVPPQYRRSVNFSSPGWHRYIKANPVSARPTDADAFRKLVAPLGATQVFTPINLSHLALTLLPDGKEDLARPAPAQSGPESETAVSQGNFTIVDDTLVKPFLAPANAARQPARGIPVLLRADEAQTTFAKSLDLPKRPKDSAEQVTWFQSIKEKVNGATFVSCYRNDAERARIDEARTQAEQIAANKGKPGSAEPDLVLALPTTPCGAVTVAKDTRTAEVKKQQDHEQAFVQEFTPSAPPRAELVTFQVVGLLPSGSSAGGIDGILSGLVGTDYGFGAVIPKDSMDALPSELRHDALFAIKAPEVSDPFTGGYGMDTMYIASFATVEKARAAVADNSCNFTWTPKCDTLAFSLQPYGTNYLAVDDIVRQVRPLIAGALGLAFGVATLIIWAMMGRVMADARRETAVFRAIGAKRSDIAAVYLTYSVWVALRIMLFAAALGVAIAGVVHLLYADRATRAAQLAYAVFTPDPRFSFLGFRSPVLWWTLGGIILMSLIAITPPLLRNIRRNPIKDMRDE
jgi:hypothetical protein